VRTLQLPGQLPAFKKTTLLEGLYMSDPVLILNAHMSALVSRLGCFDAVAETLTARWGGGCSKGTISRKVSGSLDWTVRDVIGIEDALSEFPVTRMLERRRAGVAVAAPVSMILQAGAISRETGEAVGAILAAEQSARAEDRAQACKELTEAIAALQTALSRLEAAA
jgi:hypothetical protein